MNKRLYEVAQACLFILLFCSTSVFSTLPYDFKLDIHIHK